MKAKILTLALFGLMSFSFIACNEEEVVPAVEAELSADSYCECEGGMDDRETRD
jgi:hypothetical protein